MYMLCSALLTGSSQQLKLIRVTLTSQSLPQLLSTTTPTLHPLEAMWHPWAVTNHPTPPAARFAGCCLVILSWQSPRLSQILP